MIVLTEQGHEHLQKLKARHEEKWGFPYLSPSSMNDFQDCAEKFELRKNHRGIGLTSLAGSIIHGLLEKVDREIMLRKEKKGITFKEAQQITLDLLDYDMLWDSEVELHSGKVSLQILKKEILTREKDGTFMKSKKNIRFFFEGIKPLIAKREFFEEHLAVPSVGQEIPGYWENKENRLFYGIIDRITREGNTLVITDYKTIWSKASRTNWDKTTVTLQGWLYYQMVKDLVAATQGVSKVKVVFKFFEIDLPRKYERIDYFKLSLQTFEKHMDITPEVDLRFKKTVDSVLLLKDHDLGFIGNSKFGCASCQYKDFCNHYTKPEVEKDD